METIISKLLAENGYVKRIPADSNVCDAYINHELQDCIIIYEYDIEDLANFNDSKKTKTVMKIFEETRQYENIFKNTSLVIPLKLSKFADYEVIKNIILSVEENPHAFRKYVALYTDTGINKLNVKSSLKKKLETILLDADRFKQFEEENADDEYRTVLELFVKLPFMNIRGIPSVELAEYSSPLELPENNELKDIFIKTVDVIESTTDQSYETQLVALLERHLVQNFAIAESKTHDV